MKIKEKIVRNVISKLGNQSDSRSDRGALVLYDRRNIKRGHVGE
jgi:hypothetical protein